MNRASLLGTVTLLGACLLGTAAGYGSDRGDSAVAPASRIITEAQYVNTLGVIFGPGLRLSPNFAPIPRVDGLVAVGTSKAEMTPGALDQFDKVARAVADSVTGPQNRDFLVSCKPKSDTAADDRCAKEFVTTVGRLLFRRPLTSGETQAYLAIARQASEGVHDFYRGLGVTLSSLLIAPEFLYVTQPTQMSGGQLRLTSLGKASRLSMLLWNSYPDSELLSAAESGVLDTPKGLQKQVDRMIASPRLEAGVRGFFEDMLVFENFETLSKDATTFPSFTNKVSMDAHEQTLRTLVAHVVQDDADYRDIFTTRKTFLTNDLGSIYGVKIDDPEGWIAYNFPPSDPRAGILTQVSFLALYAQPGRTSPTRRGKAIREIFLCQKVPNPPANVDFSKLQNPDPALKTSRDRLEAHRSNPVCAGCHKITDPLGLALENFDGAGAYRAEENHAAIDASGQLDGAAFADAAGLARKLHDSPQVSACLTQRLLSYALGRPLNAQDNAWTKSAVDDFAQHGYRAKHLMQTIATSDAFYAVDERATKPETTKAAADVPVSVPKQGS